MSDMIFSRISVLGAGAWGTALALAVWRAERRTTLWVREQDVLEALRNGQDNPFLPGIRLPADMTLTAELAEAVEADAILLAIPAQCLKDFVQILKPHLSPRVPLVICAKGIEKSSGRLVNEVVSEGLPGQELAVLSGPSFAREVAMALPTAVTIAARQSLAMRLQASLSSPTFRPYASEDITGVALGGAAKNVYAIACGTVEGLGLGENARAALLARSFAELARFSESLGAKRETLMGLSGLGDLVLTATSNSSRNFSFGVELAKGKSLDELNSPNRPLAEGVATAPALVSRARSFKVELPIAETVSSLLDGSLLMSEAMTRLMARKLKAE